ncbi:beta-N-acetylhexosaminidase [Agromyces intestinalis]|uniref:beta-N-acetylhexosaminidase n=1 Tax=Agromyces intestinalis TaxID=2592652 RepID=A0A5C1YDU8_9MICO|nr:beta-N-acetylhexosaminidase [Agromyces intestinalis]QEO14224.1 beta-N-acetylhexosaminidase [Agromyces intestinalis]
MLVPRPRRVAPAGPSSGGAAGAGRAGFELTASSAITADAELAPVAVWLQGALRPPTGFALPVRPIAGRLSGSIRLAIDDALPAEGYRLRVDADGVDVIGGGAAGVFSGCQSLLQLFPPAIHRRARVTDAAWRLPAVEIDDAPRFAWRGAMLDVARHFLPVRDVLRFIDLMAAHKLNRLHFHLTDDQGWRIEIPRYPRLTEVGAWRHESQVGAAPGAPGDGRPHGGYYTQDDLREIVAYAAERFVTIVPEIESPGHVQAAIAAYPELGVDRPDVDVWTGWGISEYVLNAEESTVRFFCDVLDDVMDLFPGPYIGIGGDECPRVQWRGSARVQQRMGELGLADEGEVQGWFTGRLAEHLRARGRRAFGWDELLEGEPPHDVVVASWRGSAGITIAARLGYDVVACPDDVAYLDYRQSDGPDEPIPVSVPVTVVDAFRFDPVPPGLSPEEAAHVLGGQANLWSEYMDSPRTVDFFAFPRLAAIAEALWSGSGGDEADFLRRLDAHLARLDAMGVEYRRADGPRPWQRRPGIPGRPETRAEREANIAALVAQLPRV